MTTQTAKGRERLVLEFAPWLQSCNFRSLEEFAQTSVPKLSEYWNTLGKTLHMSGKTQQDLRKCSTGSPRSIVGFGT